MSAGRRHRAGGAAALVACLAFAAGCGNETAPAKSEQRVAAAPASGTAVATDLCSEHGVLRVVCTKCNPKLAVIFRAKGDFCEEHGLPLSLCPVHHPERGGRPLVDVTRKEAPADRTRLRFKDRETARQAGFETVEAMPDLAGASIPATATLVVDASHRALVAAGAPGAVREIYVEEGARVAAGSALARMESAALAEARSRLDAAKARLQNAAAIRDRERSLFEKGMTPRREVDAAEQEYGAATAEVEAAAGTLKALGAGPEAGGTLIVRAPIAGIVTRRSAAVGRFMEAEEMMFELVDPSRLWAEIEIGERHAARVVTGDAVSIHLGPEESDRATGTLVYVAPVVDEASRVVRARARLDRADPRARVNAVHRATIRSRAAAGAVIVPREAVQEVSGASIAFVRLADDLYESRRVHVEQAEGGTVSVRRGLARGERVVTIGSFLLLTESDKSAIGTGCCEIEAPSK